MRKLIYVSADPEAGETLFGILSGYVPEFVDPVAQNRLLIGLLRGAGGLNSQKNTDYAKKSRKRLPFPLMALKTT